MGPETVFNMKFSTKENLAIVTNHFLSSPAGSHCYNEWDTNESTSKCMKNALQLLVYVQWYNKRYLSG